MQTHGLKDKAANWKASHCLRGGSRVGGGVKAERAGQKGFSFTLGLKLGKKSGTSTRLAQEGATEACLCNCFGWLEPRGEPSKAADCSHAWTPSWGQEMNIFQYFIIRWFGVFFCFFSPRSYHTETHGSCVILPLESVSRKNLSEGIKQFYRDLN